MSCRVKVMATKLEEKKSGKIKIIWLTFCILLYAPSRLYLTHEFRRARLNTFFSMFKGHKIATFPPKKKKRCSSIFFPHIIYLLCMEFTFMDFFFLYFFLIDKMENSFHLNSQSSHAQSNTKRLDRNHDDYKCFVSLFVFYFMLHQVYT